MALPIAGIPVAQSPSQGGNAFQNLATGFEVGAAISDRAKQKRINKRVKTIITESGLTPEEKLEAIAGEDLQSAMEYGNFLMLGKSFAKAQLDEAFQTAADPKRLLSMDKQNELAQQEIEFNKEMNPAIIQGQLASNTLTGKRSELLQADIDQRKVLDPLIVKGHELKLKSAESEADHREIMQVLERVGKGRENTALDLANRDKQRDLNMRKELDEPAVDARKEELAYEKTMRAKDILAADKSLKIQDAELTAKEFENTFNEEVKETTLDIETSRKIRAEADADLAQLKSAMETGAIAITTREDFVKGLLQVSEAERQAAFPHFVELMSSLDGEGESGLKVGETLLQAFTNQNGEIDLSDANLERIADNSDVGFLALNDYLADAADPEPVDRYTAVIGALRRMPAMQQMSPESLVMLAAEYMELERDADGLYLDFNGEPMTMQSIWAQDVLRHTGYLGGGGGDIFREPQGEATEDSTAIGQLGIGRGTQSADTTESADTETSSGFGDTPVSPNTTNTQPATDDTNTPAAPDVPEAEQIVRPAWNTEQGAQASLASIVRSAPDDINDLAAFLMSVPATGVTTSEEANNIIGEMLSLGLPARDVGYFDPRNPETLAVLGVALAKHNGSRLPPTTIGEVALGIVGGGR